MATYDAHRGCGRRTPKVTAVNWRLPRIFHQRATEVLAAVRGLTPDTEVVAVGLRRRWPMHGSCLEFPTERGIRVVAA